MADAASQVLLGSGLTILSQPLMYVKVLIQLSTLQASMGGVGCSQA
uniref:Mitochondrial carrier 2 n=1 Tax=Mus musculus TaxID=10090 RepID=D6RCZ1_MOUSE